jgi:hypothetical protein
MQSTITRFDGNSFGLVWWYLLEPGSVLLLKVSSSILSDANLDGLVYLLQKKNALMVTIIIELVYEKTF